MWMMLMNREMDSKVPHAENCNMQIPETSLDRIQFCMILAA